MRRRTFLQSTLTASASVSVFTKFAVAQTPENSVPHYLAAYDTESPHCLAACRKIVEMHKRHAMPATFFIVGKTLETNSSEYRQLLADPLFEIASHTYSHRMLLDHPICGAAVSLDEARKEILDGKKLVEQIFERPCLGLRPGCGFEKGFRGAKPILALIEEAGYAYVSSQLWGPDYSLPCLLSDPYNYAEDGSPGLWEIPGHGWHENLLKNNNNMGPKRITLWPPAIPEAIPTHFITKPEEEFSINRIFLDKTFQEKKTYCTFIWHPWSLHKFDPEMKMLDLTFSYVKQNQFIPCTFADFYQKIST